MTPPKTRKTYGDESIDRQLSELLAVVGDDNNDDLVRSMMVSVLDMDASDIDRLDLKIANQTLAEMLNAWRVFSPWDEQAKVTVFGSARTKPGQPSYELAVEFGREMTERGWMSITGAGPGIMQAGIEGAGRANSFGVNIALPFEQDANPAIAGDAKLASFRYFFTRKLTFMKETDAFALFPGGFGTLDETFELLTLVQTGKSSPVPIVMLDDPGSTYWTGWQTFVEHELQEHGMISAPDTDLYLHTHDPAEAADYICSFYSCYHSLRYVGGQLIVRMRSELSADAIEELNNEFGDMVRDGRIEAAETTGAERRDKDNVDLPRLAMRFDNKSFARLVTLIHRINQLAGETDTGVASGLVHDVVPYRLDDD